MGPRAPSGGRGLATDRRHPAGGRRSSASGGPISAGRDVSLTLAVLRYAAMAARSAVEETSSGGNDGSGSSRSPGMRPPTPGIAWRESAESWRRTNTRPARRGPDRRRESDDWRRRSPGWHTCEASFLTEFIAAVEPTGLRLAVGRSTRRAFFAGAGRVSGYPECSSRRLHIRLAEARGVRYRFPHARRPASGRCDVVGILGWWRR